MAAVFLHSLVDYPLVRLGLGAWAFALMGVLEAYGRQSRAAGGGARARRAMGWTQRVLAGTAAPALIFAVGAEKSASNYRLLRSKGVTVRKTIDVLIGTFCAEHGLQLIHHDSDFDLMAKHIGLDII